MLQVLGLLMAVMVTMATSRRPPPTHEPIYMDWRSFRKAGDVLKPRLARTNGKIWVHGGILLLSEPFMGIHVYDNGDPRRPQPMAFLRIPGNRDMAVRGSYLYADSFVDLLVYEVKTAPLALRLVRRVKNVFPYDWESTLPMTRVIPKWVNSEKGVVVGWRRIGSLE